MAVKRIRGIEMVYDDLEDDKEEVIVFIHGHPFNRSMWKYQHAHFAANYRLILPDLRGYGDSSVSFSRVLLDEMALDIAHLLDELRVQQAIFCGLSMGGQILLDFYRMFPARVRAMVIVDSDARGETPESYRKRMQLADLLVQEGMTRYTDGHIHEYIAPESLKNPVVYEHLYSMMTGTAPAGAAAAHRGRGERRDHVDALSSVQVPALIVVGSEDYFTPLPVARIMSDRIPGAELVCIEGAGHLPNMERPDAFNAALEGFLKKL